MKLDASLPQVSIKLATVPVSVTLDSELEEPHTGNIAHDVLVLQ